jgi:hypothetical protein
MRRLRDFWSGLPILSKLQYVFLAFVLGSLFYYRDLNPKNQFLGQPLWHVTLPLILGTIVLGRLLLPIMRWRPKATMRVLYTFGLAVFLAGLYCAMQGLNRSLLFHFGFTLALWLDASCWFWFISETQRLANEFTLATALPSHQSQPDEDEESER